MQKYNFHGKDTSEKEFWKLCSLTNLEEIEKELYGKHDQKEIQSVLNYAIAKFNQKDNQKINTPKCGNCGSRMILNNAKWGKYWHCSNIINCFSIQLI